MEFQIIKPIIIMLLIALIVSVNAEKYDIDEKPPNITPESVIQDFINCSSTARESKSRVKRQFGGYGYPGPYNGRRRVRPYPPIIFGGGGPGFGRGFGGRGFGGRGFGGRGGGFGGRGGGHGGGGGRG